MAIFVGTNKEFRRYVGPRLRNQVQQLAKAYKAETAACQQCGSTNALESAHVKGRDRNQIIDQILADNSSKNVVTVMLDWFEEKFREAHDPIDETILILCRSCHTNYDSAPSIAKQSIPEPVIEKKYQNHLLPITLDPSNPDIFKSELLISKRAEIQINYADGRTEYKPWDASRFKTTSNVFGNLRSRTQFRSGVWKGHNIDSVHVRVE